MSPHSDADFGRWRSLFWPIHRYEVKKVLPMMLMLVLICFNYSVLRNLKDVVVITAKSSGAEVIPFIKVWALFPMAVLFTLMYTKLSSKISQEKVFYTFISLFISFYVLFVLVLYPAKDFLHPYESAQFLESVLPGGFKGFISMYRNWTFTLFYVMCELWGSMILTVLFWGFANEVTKIAEARRFYSVLGVGSNLAAVFAGQVANFFAQSSFNPALPFGKDAWEQTLIILVFVLAISGVVITGLFYWMNKNVLNDSSFHDLHATDEEKPRSKKKKQKLSLKESFRFLAGSKYLIYIAIIVVSYNLVINLVELVWKDQLRNLYPSPLDYSLYTNNLTSLMGIFSTIASLFMARTIGFFGWTKTALVTPFIMLVTSLGFFFFFFLQNSVGEAFFVLSGMSPLAIAVFFGSAQNCLSKASKYSFFDTTKEMAFIPLDHETKLKGKAAIDGVGSRLGKSGGSFFHQGLLMIFVTFSASAPYIAAILMVMIGLWIVAVKKLGHEFALLVAKKDPEALKELEEKEAQVLVEPKLTEGERAVQPT